MSRRMRANIMLTLTAMIWGAAFVAQSVGMEFVGPFTFQAVRCLLGGLVLLPVIAVLDKKDPSAARRGTKKDIWIGGMLCGLFLFVAASLQQVGLIYTSAGKSGFITALYVVLVPCVGLLFGRRVPPVCWAGSALAVAALYLLCVDEGLSMGRGELLTLGCALCFTGQILVIDRYTARADGVRLSCVQLFTASALSFLCMFLFEEPSLSAIARCWLPIGYAGILSCGVAYTLQIVAQRDTSPVVASLLMSLESVFAALAGALLLRERLTGREYLGCALMFLAIMLSQLPQKDKTRSL